jgi:uncharacterized protein
MEINILEIIVCPLCRKELQLTVKEQNKQEIITGLLFCSTCDKTYLISDTIPDLLPCKVNS